MNFCKMCVEGNCPDHKWFTDLKLKDENEILIADLNRIIKNNIICMVISDSFLVYSQIDYFKYHHFINYTDGELTFHVNVPPSAKLNEYYIPVSCYKNQENIVDYKIEIIVSIMRHTPIVLKIYDNIFEDTLLHEVQLIHFVDNIHISMEDFHKMVDLATSRLKEYIEKLQSCDDNEGMETNGLVNYPDFDDKDDVFRWLKKYKIKALEYLYQEYENEKFSSSLFSEVLELVGTILGKLDIDNNLVIDIFKKFYNNGSLDIRYGVVEGISSLNPKFSIPALEDLYAQENDSRILKKMIGSYIEQLKTIGDD